MIKKVETWLRRVGTGMIKNVLTSKFHNYYRVLLLLHQELIFAACQTQPELYTLPK